MRDVILKSYKDFECFVSLVHQMKGVGGNYGYPILTELCVSIEINTKDKNFNKVNIKLEEFKYLCEKILAGKDENHKMVE